MTDTVVKTENDNDTDSDASLDTLTTLLEEVKKEELPECMPKEEPSLENNNATTLPESFFDDLYREELEAAPDEITTDADIQKLQELIAKKKRILDECVESAEDGKRSKSRSCSPDNQKRKKNSTNDDENINAGSPAKRPKITTNNSEEDGDNQNVLLNHDIHDKSNETNDVEQGPSPATELPSLQTNDATDPELELEKLLKSEDYNSDENTPNPHEQAMSMANTMQPMFGYPNTMTMFNAVPNQMMAGMPGMMCNMGFPPGFYPQNAMNMQMMGYGFPQVNVLPSNNNEVQCLPVDKSSQLQNIPFRKIKLEKADKSAEQAEDPKKKIVDSCIQLLEKMDFPEGAGKFFYTSTITRNQNDVSSNSILKKITNVSYNFQSIGPKQNLEDWGLKGIPNANIEIAKKISLNAEKYFEKLGKNANTIARKLIKQENVKADKNVVGEEQMEVEELTISSYFKNSMTQTDAIVCRECVSRKRKVGHAIAVQASVYTGNIGTQTKPELGFCKQLTEGLSENQLKAMHDFSQLIRESPKNTSGELSRVQERLMSLYNLSQGQHKGIVPFIETSGRNIQSSGRDPRNDNHHHRRMINDPRRFTNPATQNHMAEQPYVQNYQQDESNYSQPPTPAQIYGQIRNDYEQPEHTMRYPPYEQHLVYPEQASQYPGHNLPRMPGQDFPQRSGAKHYGRGGLRR